MKTEVTSSSLVVLMLCSPALAHDAMAHQTQIERKSEQVMPFSMDGTKHVFTPTANGGTQAVLVTNGDQKQIALVRAHLRKESVAFARGDYSDPAEVHGSSMPGLASFQRSRGKLQVSYANVPAGAKIAFVTRDAQMIEALHRWFAAQVRDHGAHAMMMKM